jgi:hypothetical protein
MPGYGWVDFDPTSFAIPPPGGGLLANMRVVIPIITIEELPAFAEFPWQVLLRGALMLAVVLLVGIYLYRYGMIAHLRIRSRGSDPESLHALLTLLLMKLSFNGYALKSPSQTPLEYARTYPELQRFASLYTELRYRERFAEGERAQLRREMLEDYASIVHTARRRGFVGTLQRGFSLRGLSYR